MKAFNFLNVLSSLIGMAFCSKEATWNYELGGNNWRGTCSEGSSQSPINIPFSEPVQLTPERGDFLRLDFDLGASDDLEVFNNGHTVLITSNSTPTSMDIPIVNGMLHGILSGGSKTAANTEYVPGYFFNFHLHEPSEHSYDGLLAPMEGHMVMQIFKEDLPSCPMDFCFSVLSFRFQYTSLDTENKFIAQLLEAIGGEWPSHIDDSAKVSFPVDFSELLPSDSPSYVVYNGSLTTPPCTEYVLWHIFEEPLPVSVEQVATLESVISKVSEGTGRNSRTIRPLNGRTLGYVSSGGEL
eukprot:TRINITY_DN116_c0_g1_i14.p1 TRINITY_DN116_c0_g1~~TRINITY_DN116_c0_g1_i14.p1  ORF type:complete len:332 (-),score=26.70 TRINITY_DN116_c0_g1_i14:12-902(-)